MLAVEMLSEERMRTRRKEELEDSPLSKRPTTLSTLSTTKRLLCQSQPSRSGERTMPNKLLRTWLVMRRTDLKRDSLPFSSMFSRPSKVRMRTTSSPSTLCRTTTRKALLSSADGKTRLMRLPSSGTSLTDLSHTKFDVRPLSYLILIRSLLKFTVKCSSYFQIPKPFPSCRTQRSISRNLNMKLIEECSKFWLF